MNLQFSQDVGKFLLAAYLAARAQLRGIRDTETRISAGSRYYCALQRVFRSRVEYHILKYAKKGNLPPIPDTSQLATTNLVVAGTITRNPTA
jgi:hypothetical protein